MGGWDIGGQRVHESEKYVSRWDNGLSVDQLLLLSSSCVKWTLKATIRWPEVRPKFFMCSCNNVKLWLLPNQQHHYMAVFKYLTWKQYLIMTQFFHDFSDSSPGWNALKLYNMRKQIYERSCSARTIYAWSKLVLILLAEFACRLTHNFPDWRCFLFHSS